jgi:hypothetical protein
MINVLPFGKYTGKSFEWVALHDPDYLFWLTETKAIRHPTLQLEVDKVSLKAKNIKIPTPDSEDWCVVYIADKQGALADINVIPKARLSDYRHAYWDDHIDLSLARKWKNYDKLGGRILVREVKRLYFNENEQLTDQRCRSFFANPDNFAFEDTSEVSKVAKHTAA